MAQVEVNVDMTGVIISVCVKEGDEVLEDDELCVQEAMKMENPILAPVGGKVTHLGVTEGQLANTGHLVAVIKY